VDFDATLSEDLFESAGAFVVDDLAQYRYYRQQGYFAGYPANAVELAEVLADETPRGRGLAIFVPLGIALEDVAVAAELNRRAAAEALGSELPL
jgi:ornithine cyclodeaminase/alanine dehydrogenase-like protein (mu-crystallin family)